MAENKEYITQEQENGTVNFSADVICTIVSNAIKDVEGVVGLAVKSGLDFSDIFGKKSASRGMKVMLTRNEDLRIDCDINIYYGESVVAIANAVQDSVRNAIESTTGIKVDAVNVNICGIVRQ